jgi:hypothetical protein
MHTEALNSKCNEDAYWSVNNDLISIEFLNLDMHIMNFGVFPFHCAKIKEISV